MRLRISRKKKAGGQAERRVLLLLVGCLLATCCRAQQIFRLHLLPLDTAAAFLETELKFKPSPGDSLSINGQLRGLLEQLRSRSFLEASVDTLDCRDSTCLAILHIGPAYRWVSLLPGNVPGEYLNQSGFRERLFRGRPFAYADLQRLQQKLLDAAADNGFPFASVSLDNIGIRSGQATATLRLRQGELIRLDSISMTGNLRISRGYLENYLGLRPGAPYSRERILRSRDRLRELPFLQAAAEPVVGFRGGRATVTFPLERKNASRFDFLIGVLPQSGTTGRMLITGNFEGEFLNQFGLGERLYARFEQLRPQTQELRLAFGYPYALGLPFGADFDFSLYKKDTTFTDLVLDLGFSLLSEGGNYLRAFWNQRSSALLTVDEATLLLNPRLPDPLDLRNTSFGLEWLHQRLDYRSNPRSGWSLFLRGSAGIKRVLRNSRIEGLELGYLYDSLTLRSFQYRASARLESYLPLFSRSTLKTAFHAGWLLSAQPTYRNEQYRLGGNRLLRGFDEQFFFATRYAAGTLEYRLLSGQNSYLFTFCDFAWLLDRTTRTDEALRPIGFGTGITLETRIGLFGLSLAFGTMLGEPVDFGRPKMHFGYVSLF